MLDIQLVQQINGNVRIDDGDEGPLLKLEFIAEFASGFSDEDKDQVLEVVVDKLVELLADRDE